jgi:hypothetical protein
MRSLDGFHQFIKKQKTIKSNNTSHHLPFNAWSIKFNINHWITPSLAHSSSNMTDSRRFAIFIRKASLSLPLSKDFRAPLISRFLGRAHQCSLLIWMPASLISRNSRFISPPMPAFTLSKATAQPPGNNTLAFIWFHRRRAHIACLIIDFDAFRQGLARRPNYELTYTRYALYRDFIDAVWSAPTEDYCLTSFLRPLRFITPPWNDRLYHHINKLSS